MLDELRVERDERRAILESAGFAPDDRSFMPDDRLRAESLSLDEAAAAVERARWPCFVVDKFLSVAAANPVAQALWGVDMMSEFPDPLDRNLLSVATNPRFADRVVNWEEAVGHIIAERKAHDWAPEHLDQPSPYLAAQLERFMSGESKYVTKLGDLWQRAPEQWAQKMRWSYPVIWNEPGIGELRFECLTGITSGLAGLAFNDWIPVDAETWTALEKVKNRLHTEYACPGTMDH